MAVKVIQAFHCKDNYVFIPACCYSGNQFRVLKYNYPPMFRACDAKVEMPVTITDVPRLEIDGSGKIEVSTGDAATPCIGVFSKTEARGILVFTVQQIKGKNIGLAYENGEIRLSWPAKREQSYRITRMFENTVEWIDEDGEIPCRILDFSCNSLSEFFRVFFENRKIMELDADRAKVIPYAEQFEIMRNKFNTMNWHEKLEFYKVGTTEESSQVWQPGWVGGTMSGYSLAKLGGNCELQRQIKTIEFLFSTQCESGFFWGIIDGKGKALGDGFGVEGTENWHLTRKSADVLYFLFKNFKLLQEKNIDISEEFLCGTKKLADAFVRLFDQYGQFGQFVDLISGEIRVGGSASAAIAPAGLAEAYLFFNCSEYLRVAKESAEYYYQNFLIKGFTTGGPGEILQCVDSESAFALLESFVVLYAVTGEKKWLDYAEESAYYCSSWVVSYNYLFPEDCEFSRLAIKTVGSVFANIQNKHSAPGIATLSGDSLYKLWKWTGDPLYLELIKDIATTIGQYMSTDSRPICDSYVDPNLTNEEKAAFMDKHRLPQGFINERVNMSDWEGEGRIGEVFWGSCWSETSNLLSLAEVIPLLEKEAAFS